MKNQERLREKLLDRIAEEYVQSPRSGLFPTFQARGARNLLNLAVSIQLDEQARSRNSKSNSPVLPTDTFVPTYPFEAANSPPAFALGQVDEKITTYYNHLLQFQQVQSLPRPLDLDTQQMQRILDDISKSEEFRTQFPDIPPENIETLLDEFPLNRRKDRLDSEFRAVFCDGESPWTDRIAPLMLRVLPAWRNSELMCRITGAINITPPESFNIDTWAKGAFTVLVVTLPTFYYASIKVISSIDTLERRMDAMLGFTYIFAITVVLITDSRRYEFFPATTAYFALLLVWVALPLQNI
jgi:hypothetical protein